MIDLEKLLETPENFEIHFQPIFSAVKPQLIGFEALLRVEPTLAIPPSKLFSIAKKQKLSIQLDRLARELAIKKFSQSEFDKTTILFLNFESSVIDEGVLGSNHILNTAKKYGLDPSRIAIEIKEDEVYDTNALLKFCRFYENQGFIIALDDVGASSSSLIRFDLIKPKIIKIDRGLIKDIDAKFYSAKIVNSLIQLCHATGTLVLAEGVETHSEVVQLMLLGIDMYQGFYFAKPSNSLICKCDFLQMLSKISNDTKILAQENNLERNRAFKYGLRITKDFVDVLQNSIGEDFKNLALSFLQNNPSKADAIFVLDKNGILIEDTATIYQPKEKSTLFNPGLKGDNFASRDYFYATLNSNDGVFLTQNYLSKASGNLCYTFAKKISYQNETYIICIDIKV